MLHACRGGDMADGEQGYFLKVSPGARCERTSVMFEMKHLHLIDAPYQCKLSLYAQQKGSIQGEKTPRRRDAEPRSPSFTCLLNYF